MTLPITELRNEFSSNLDGGLDSNNFLRVLRATDAQIFSGWGSYLCLYDHEIVNDCLRAAIFCSDLITKSRLGGNVAIIMTGCGTSGRIAFLTARRFNDYLRRLHLKPCFHYLISGGDSALLLSDELPEDDPAQGAFDLNELIKNEGLDGYYLIGVTCGLSAPYVAGQINYALDPSQLTPISGACVLGFNPIHLSRDQPIEKASGNWSFRDQALALGKRRDEDIVSGRYNYAVINPVIGPEPVAGSSRMKGGSATAILLDVVCRYALQIALTPQPSAGPSTTALAEMLLEYETCRSKVYSTGVALLPNALSSQECSLGGVMSCAARALGQGGRLYFLGSGSGGCMALIDSSEMPDTYGSPFDQIRSFCGTGWGELSNACGDLSSLSPLHQISLQDFQNNIASTLAANDCIVLVYGGDGDSSLLIPLAEVLSRGPSNLCLIGVNATLVDPANSLQLVSGASDNPHPQLTLQILLSLCGPNCIINLGVVHSGLVDFALKLLLNATSTYAQAAGRGAVHRGLMITTGPANDKIYERCVRLIQETVPSATRDEAEIALIKSIYGIDGLSSEVLSAPRSVHIKASILPADQRHRSQTILPVAMIILAGTKSKSRAWTIAAAKAAINSQPIISKILAEVMTPDNIPTLSNVSRTQVVNQASDGIKKEDLSEFCVVFDMGGTKIRAALVRKALIVPPIAVRVVGSDRSVGAVFSLITSLYAEVTGSVRLDTYCPSQIVFAQPGQVLDDGSIYGLANYSSWTEPVPLRAFLQKLAGPNTTTVVRVIGDAEAALHGELSLHSEMRNAAEMKQRSICIITIGTGVGTGVYIAKKCLSGGRGLIEGGHQIVNTATDARICACGQKGCLEAYSSGSAISQMAKEYGLTRINSDANLEEELTAETVIEEAQQGNPIASMVINEAARYLAVGCLNLIRFFDPHAIIISGALGRYLLPLVKEHYAGITWSIHDDLASIPLLGALLDEPGITGCAALTSSSVITESTLAM